VPTPFGLFPSDINFGDLLTALENGARQGIQDFVDDLGSLSGTDSGSSAALNSLDSLPSLTDIVNAIGSAASSAYGALLPTADLINALLTTAPVYAATVFADELAAGDPTDAIGLPIAGLLGLGSVALGYEYIVIEGAVAAISADFASLIP
jgi:hypothetical protein